MQSRRIRQFAVLASAFVAWLGLSTGAFAAERVNGVILNRADDGTITVQADDQSNVTVVLTELTRIRRTDGIRQETSDAATLIPGLRVRVRGDFDSGNRLTADR